LGKGFRLRQSSFAKATADRGFGRKAMLMADV
jgi:hypothetical protein